MYPLTRLQLFFNCTLCHTGRMLSLVFFSTFEPICLTLDSCLQRKGVPMLYERAAKEVPTLYVCPVENVLGQVALILCYTANTIPHKYRSRIPRKAGADSRPDSCAGIRLFEVNVWVWRYGGPFRVRSLWSKQWNCERNECRNPGHEALKLCVAGKWRRRPPLNSN
jgi:hypothetical protein